MIGEAHFMENGPFKKDMSMRNTEITNKNDSIARENDQHLTSSTDTFASTSSGFTNASIIDNHAKNALASTTKINSSEIIRPRRHLHRSKNSRKDSQAEKLKDATSSTRKVKDISLPLHQRSNDKSVDHLTSIHGNDDASKLDISTLSSTVTTSSYMLTSSSIAVSSLNFSEDNSLSSSSGTTYRESKSTIISDETNNSTSMKSDVTEDKSHSESVELMSYSFPNVEEPNDTKILDKLQQRIDNIIATHTNSSKFFNSIAVGSQDQTLIQGNMQDVTSSMTNGSSVNHNGTTTKKIPEIEKSYDTQQSSLASQALRIEEPEKESNEFLKMPLKINVPLILNSIGSEHNTDSAGVSELNMQSDKKAKVSGEEISPEQPGIIHSYGPQCSTNFNKEKKEGFDNKLQKNIAFHERLADDASMSASAGKTQTDACSTNNAAPSRFERSMDTTINTNTNFQLTVSNNSMNTEQGDANGCSIGSQCDSPSMNDTTIQTFQNNNLNVENRSMGDDHLIESTSVNSTPIDNNPNNSVTIQQISPDRIGEETNNEKKSIFLPHINFRDETESTSSSSTSNFHLNKSLNNHVKENSTTDESIYIIEGLGYFKDNLDDMREFEEDLEKRRDPFMNYGDSVDDIILTPQDNMHKMFDSVPIESGPAMDHHISTSQLHWEGNFVDRIMGSWRPNEDSRAVRTLDDNIGKANFEINSNRKIETEDKLKLDQFRESLRLKDMDNSSSTKLSGGIYQYILLRAFYVTIGVTLFALSIWCKRALITRKPNIPGLRRFFLKRRRSTQGAV